MLSFICRQKSTNGRIFNWLDLTDWLADFTLEFTEEELMADLHSGRGAL